MKSKSAKRALWRLMIDIRRAQTLYARASFRPSQSLADHGSVVFLFLWTLRNSKRILEMRLIK